MNTTLTLTLPLFATKIDMVFAGKGGGIDVDEEGDIGPRKGKMGREQI